MKLKTAFALTLLLLSSLLPLTAAPIPMDIKKAVVFIYAINSPTNAVPDGTGFLVEIPDAKETNSVFGYLITAKHVLRPPPANNCKR